MITLELVANARRLLRATSVVAFWLGATPLEHPAAVPKVMPSGSPVPPANGKHAPEVGIPAESTVAPTAALDWERIKNIVFSIIGLVTTVTTARLQIYE